MKFVLITSTLLGLMALAGCSPGWTVGDFEPYVSDSTYANIEILDSDSVLHFYNKDLSFNEDMWCYVHSQYEVIRKK